ncbi:MAG: hypothetical protein VZQ47_04240 [Treponema sp.]|nr:hypothetical protein [Treponema sp.]MEE3434751.1 hypothetical protein [Treponema sp.]
MIDFSEIGGNIREFFSQRQKALLLSCVLIIFFCAALIAIILIPQKKEVPSAAFRSEPLEADQELLLPQGVSIPQEYAVSRQTNEKWTEGQIHEWLSVPDEEAVKKLSASNDSLVKSITEAAP